MKKINDATLENHSRKKNSLTLEELHQLLRQNAVPGGKVAFPCKGGFYMAWPREIIRFEGNDMETIVHLVYGTKKILAGNLKVFEEILRSNLFYRIRNNHLVNIEYIIQINKTDGGSLRMADDKLLLISSDRLIDFLTWYIHNKQFIQWDAAMATIMWNLYQSKLNSKKNQGNSNGDK